MQYSRWLVSSFTDQQPLRSLDNNDKKKSEAIKEKKDFLADIVLLK